MRIQRYISETGYCSRRETKRLIEQGRITINGQVASKDSFITDQDQVLIDQQPIPIKQKNIYLILNKPVGIICTSQQTVKNNIIDYIRLEERIFAVGRLDKDSQGLLLLTNDGEIVNTLMKHEHGHEEEYLVTVDRPYPDQLLVDMAKGVPMLGQVTKACTINRVDERTFKIILTQGLNRQIRRMTKAFGYYVVRLERLRIGTIQLGDLAYGDWRELTELELQTLKQQIR